jgi:hypothetical protein
MGQGDPSRQHQGGVIGATSTKYSVTPVPRMAAMTALFGCRDVRLESAFGGKPDIKQTSPNDRV